MSQASFLSSPAATWLESASSKWAFADDSGYAAVDYVSVLAVTVRIDGQVVSAPVEEGSFASYNKVVSPIEITLSLGFQGTDDELQTALDKLEEMQKGTELYRVVTPNAEYTNLNVESFSYDRKAELGLGAVYAELRLVEVKQVAAEYTSVNLATNKNRGKVQTENKETSILSHITG